jgi:hypothetical protein
MAIKDTNAFLDSLIAELQAMKEDPDKDTVARVLGMVLRVAKKHNDHTELKRSFITAAMSFDGIDQYEYEVLKRWDEEN